MIIRGVIFSAPSTISTCFWMATGLVYSNFNNNMKYTLIVKSLVLSYYYITDYLVSIYNQGCQINVTSMHHSS